MNSSPGDVLKAHCRIGYVSALLWIDFALALWVLADIARFKAPNRSIAFALRTVPDILTTRTAGYALLLLALLTLVTPFILAVFRITRGSPEIWSLPFRYRGPWVVTIHLVSVFGIVALYLVLLAAEVAAGNAVSGSGELVFGYYSSFDRFFVSGASWVVIALGFVLSRNVSLILKQYVAPSKLGDNVEEYLIRMRLADLGGNLYPAMGRRRMNFNTAGAAPEIQLARREFQKHMARYEAEVTTSNEAQIVLKGLAEECRTRLREIIPKARRTDTVIEFCTGTSRALEIALVRLNSESGCIVLSPYEHPVERKVVSHFCAVSGRRSFSILPDTAFFLTSAAKQLEYIEKAVAKFDLVQHSTITLICSEVCYASGTVVDVASVVQVLEKVHSGKSVRVIVDGAHSIGNYTGAAAFLGWDSYVFSAHKWLLASEPCGILMSRTTPDLSSVAYDVWQSDLPASFSSARMIAAFRSSLEIFRQMPLERLVERSTIMRDRFKKRLNQLVTFISWDAGHTPTCMVTLRPAEGKRWTCEVQTLRAHFLKNAMYPLIIDDIEPDTPWVRVAFPYFLDVRAVDALCRAVEAVISDRTSQGQAGFIA
jgi:cysteine sulfinate desulfinase/cysteine desulfurase-like protein